jgi:hypothetical protein
MTHTPGPWKAIKHPDAGYDIDHVATGHGIVTDLGVESEENAHLIAAAPDLLAACEEFSAAWGWEEEIGEDEMEEIGNALLTALKAIKKAKGEN